MKVYNVDHREALKPGLQKALEYFRRKRGFDAAAYIDAKAALLNQYYAHTPLKTAIVLMSGGIDSSVVAGIVAHAKKQSGSTIEKIVATTIPAYVSGATGQSDAARRAYDVMDALGVERLTQDITRAHEEIIKVLEDTRGVKLDKWAKGQIVAHVRTALSAGNASVDTMLGKPALVIGTTNRDEGAYLGYVGKWSDGMVDLQLISDLHKSEVYKVARHLNLPASTINAIPRGDMYDNRTDTEVFGAPYDFVELYINYLELPEQARAALLARFNEDELTQFNGMAANLENLHRYNAHKYQGNQVSSPAFHFNVLPSGVPGGWSSGKFGRVYPHPDNPEKIFNGYFELSQEFLDAAQGRNRDQALKVEERPITAPNDLHPKTALILDPLIPAEEAQALVAETANKKWEPAGLDGYKQKSPEDPIGSWRATAYSPEYAQILWERIAGTIPMIRHIPTGTNLDAQTAAPGAIVWRPVGINPAFRFIKYDPTKDNLLFPHYDAPPNKRPGDPNIPDTLDSLVIYLTNAQEGMGGETAFLVDPQRETSALSRNLKDWNRSASPEEILTKVVPQQGLGVIFPHRVLHSSQRLDPNGPEKIIIRSDIMYEPVVTP